MRLALTLCTSALLFACARGSAGPLTDEDAGSFVGAVGATPDGGGANTGASNSPPDTNGGNNQAGSTGSDATGGNSSGAASAGEADGGDGEGVDGGTPLACRATAAGSCANPQDLGEIAGNNRGTTIVKSDSGSAWFRITVSDDDSNGYVESTMGLGLTLKSSDTTANYDLFLYRDGDGACSDRPYKSEKPSGEDAVDHIWNAAGPVAGQTRTLTIEVRQVSAMCGTWTLEIEPHPCSTFAAPAGDTCATR